MNSPHSQASGGVKVRPGTDTLRLQSADTCSSICFFCTLDLLQVSSVCYSGNCEQTRNNELTRLGASLSAL